MYVFRMTSEMFPGKCIGRAMFKRKSLNHHKIAGKIQNGVKLQIFLKKIFIQYYSIYGHIIYFLCEKLKTVKHYELKKWKKNYNFILQLALKKAKKSIFSRNVKQTHFEMYKNTLFAV